MDEQHNDLIGDILKASGEKDNFKLKGKGKPLPKDYMERDVFQNFQKIAKDAGYLPYWLKLQKEIAVLVHEAATEKDISKINKKIKEYNRACPPTMQKLPVKLEEMERAKKIW